MCCCPAGCNSNIEARADAYRAEYAKRVPQGNPNAHKQYRGPTHPSAEPTIREQSGYDRYVLPGIAEREAAYRATAGEPKPAQFYIDKLNAEAAEREAKLAVPPMPEGFIDPHAPDAAERLEAAKNEKVEVVRYVDAATNQAVERVVKRPGDFDKDGSLT